MTDEPEGLITPQDVEAITTRLKEWMPTLPEQEQLVLGWVLTRAAAAEEDDVAEYVKRSDPGVPVSTLMAEAAGLQDVSGYATSQPGGIVIRGQTWTFRW